MKEEEPEEEEGELGERTNLPNRSIIDFQRGRIVLASVEGTRQAIEDILVLKLPHLQDIGARTVQTYLNKEKVKMILGDMKWAWHAESGTQNYAEDGGIPLDRATCLNSEIISQKRASPKTTLILVTSSFDRKNESSNSHEI